MDKLELKRQIIHQAIENLEELKKDLLDEINLKNHNSDGNEYGVSSGDYGEISNSDTSKETAAIIEKEAEKISDTIQVFKEYRFEQEKSEVGLLSLVQTNKGNFLICKPAKEVKVNNEKYFLLGTDAPIYQMLQGKVSGDKFVFNNIRWEIKAVS